MKVEVINLTPHACTVMDEQGNTILNFNPSGKIARLLEEYSQPQSLEIGSVNVQAFIKTVSATVDLPEPQDGVCFFVSFLVADANPHRRDLVFPGQAVRNEKGQIVGIKNFAQVPHP